MVIYQKDEKYEMNFKFKYINKVAIKLFCYLESHGPNNDSTLSHQIQLFVYFIETCVWQLLKTSYTYLMYLLINFQ